MPKLPTNLATGFTAKTGAKAKSCRMAPKRDGSMNQTEAQYALYLQARKQRGEVLDWCFEPEKLRLADKTYYQPDFRVLVADGTIEFHEVKGFMRDDAAVKLKVVAEQHWMYTFRLVRKDRKGGGWKVEEI